MIDLNEIAKKCAVDIDRLIFSRFGAIGSGTVPVWQKEVEKAILSATEELRKELNEEIETSRLLGIKVAEQLQQLTAAQKDRERLDLAILYPKKFAHLMETRAHGGFPEQELQQGRQAIDSAIHVKPTHTYE